MSHAGTTGLPEPGTYQPGPTEEGKGALARSTDRRPSAAHALGCSQVTPGQES
jgi:hypothetical protein